MSEFIYNDYASWLIENEELINFLKDNQTQLYDRYEYVFLVIDYIYHLKVEHKEFDEDHHKIFSIGFHYLFTQFESIKLILENNFDGNLKELISFDRSLVLFLWANEIQEDIYDSLEDEATELIKPFKEIENKIFEYLSKKKHVPKELFEKLDNALIEVYTNNDEIYEPIYSIYYDIAEELNLIK